jgi:hypothetical protein
VETLGDAEGVDQTELDTAVAEGKTILSAFIGREYRQEAAKVTPTS